MAAAIPFAPLIIGAGAGALLDKKKPLRGALLGALGGGVAGPAMSAMTTGLSGAGAGIMSGAGAAGIPMGAQQAAMLGAQVEGMGAAGVAHTLGSAGASPMMANALGAATMGPQGLFASMPKDKIMGMGQQALGLFNQPQQQPMVPPPARTNPISQTPMITPFQTSMLRNRRQYG
jgi:hypothetical protein